MHKYVLFLAIAAILGPFSMTTVGAQGPGDNNLSEITVGDEPIVLDAGDFMEMDSGEDFISGGLKMRWLRISGPVIWTFMVLAIGLRHIRLKGKARVLNRWHKIFGYAAFCIGTIHGTVGLFF